MSKRSSFYSKMMVRIDEREERKERDIFKDYKIKYIRPHIGLLNSISII
jgi:hypothetical protein